MGERGFHKGHLESPREAWRMWDSKVSTVSKVLWSCNELERFFQSDVLKAKRKKKACIYLWRAAIHGCILWLILNEVEKQFYPFHAEKSSLSITIVHPSIIVPSCCLNYGQCQKAGSWISNVEKRSQERVTIPGTRVESCSYLPNPRCFSAMC